MANWWRCLAGCNGVTPISDEDVKAGGKKCIVCNVTRGEIITQEQFNESFAAGAIFNIDPRTGKRSKKKR
jgi:hypothetical protein